MNRRFVRTLVSVCFIVYMCEAQEELIVRTEKCLQCICYGSSSCDATTRCSTYGNDENTGRVCGPFQITKAYWEDAGKPGGDFVTCVNTQECSETTVLNYMNLYGKDCDGDGQVTCADYARIHTAGIKECDAPWVEFTHFWTSFKACNSDKTKSRSGFVENRAMLRSS